jgi:hypothetical protein
VSDFDFEPVKGLPEKLPVGERIVWQGAPSWRDLAVNAFHVRKVLVYFALLGIVQALAQVSTGATLLAALKPFVWLIPMGIAAAAILTGIAWASARTTVYTITNRRVVMRIGIALPITLNIPFKRIDGASVRLFGNGTGDIPLTLHEGSHFAYLVLWPHAKPWDFAKPKPTLRSIPQADRVAQLLAGILSGAQAVLPVVQKQAGFSAPAVAA